MKFNYEECLKSYDEKIQLVRRIIIGLATENIRGLVISGSPGIGKSHTITNTLEALKNGGADLNFYISKGHITPYQLYTCMNRFKNKNDILVFDDCDAVLNNTESLNLLKAATEFSEHRYISWTSTKNLNNGINSMIEYNGKIIISTNKPLTDNPHFNAFIDRVHYYDMKVTFEEKLSKIISISNNLGAKVDPDVDHVDIVKFLLDNSDRIDQDKFSIRNFIKLVEMKSLFKNDWIKYLNIMESVIDYK